MDAQEEFKEILECYYFDYNIINSIFSFWDHLDNKSYHTSFLSYMLLNQFYDMKKICIPYSFGHIWDILNGTKFTESKIDVINTISKGWYVNEDDSDSNLIRIDKCNNIHDHFKDTFESLKFANEIQSTFDPLIEIAFESSMLNYIISEDYSIELHNKIVDLYKEKKVKSQHDVLQFSYKVINTQNIKNNINFENISKELLISKLNTYIKNNKFLGLINVKNIIDFENFQTKFQFNNDQSEFSKKVFINSFLCDYIGLTKETKNKVYKKTFASGMINDLLHLSVGLRCSKFVSNDRNLLIKAIVCKVLLNLNVKIYCIENFYQHIINEYVKYNYPGQNEKIFTVSMSINNNQFQKTIKTNFEKKLYN
jgi:hypothetical protein